MGGESGGGGAAGAGGNPDENGCVPASTPDIPDDDFLDTDCDGIDGSAARAIFVAPSGSDVFTGTMSHPVATIARAIELAGTSNRSVYVCNGDYAENLVVSHGVSVYGGYDCEQGWRRLQDRARVAPKEGLALSIARVSDPIVFDRIAFRAADAKSAGQSSQAAGIVDAGDVTFSHVEFVAGDGSAGAKGNSGDDAADPPPVSNSGDDAPTDACEVGDGGRCAHHMKGGTGTSQVCAYGSDNKMEMVGGDGGEGANAWLDQNQPDCVPSQGSEGQAGGTGQYRINGGRWQSVSDKDSGTDGDPGEDGAPADSGLGSLKGTVYVATNAGSSGERGDPGWPGRGGDGGGSPTSSGDLSCYTTFWLGSGGGEGGLGGCGGEPATGGGGGGGSIALVLVSSNVQLRWAHIVTGNGGKGGDGALGGKGQRGGDGADAGDGVESLRGMSGQRGGRGGQGGAGGPGGGGPAIGILYSGSKPSITNAVFELGLPGPGGTPKAGKTGPSGVTGQLYELPE
jgi:hypothetical protein